MKLIDKNKLLEELKKLKQNLSASPIVVIEDVESLVESLEVKDYEQKYLDALAKAREIHRNENEKRFDMEWLFPELAESGDERIKKDIKRAISVALDYSYFDKETADNCLAWLEKLGEQDNWAEELNTKIKELHKQCLEIIQKYVFPCEGCNNIKGCVTCVDGSEKAFYEGATSRKQEWSEEDSFRTETLISVIKSGGSIRHELRDEYVNWLKSLKDRVQPKKE